MLASLQWSLFSMRLRRDSSRVLANPFRCEAQCQKQWILLTLTTYFVSLNNPVGIIAVLLAHIRTTVTIVQTAV